MVFFSASDQKVVENQMASLVNQYEEEKKVVLFPPGTLQFLLYVLSICVGVVCTVFLYGLTLIPLVGIEEGINRLLLPMGTSVFLIIIILIGLLSIVSGVTRVYRYLGVTTLLIFAMTLLFTILYLVDLKLPNKALHGTAVLTLFFSFLLFGSEKFYCFVSYFRARKVLKKFNSSKDKKSSKVD